MISTSTNYRIYKIFFASNCEFGINMILSLLVMYPKLKSLWMDHKGRYFSFYAVASVTGLMFPTL